MNQMLSGLRVIDLTLQLPGPFCTLMLADYGAEVIRVDEPYPRQRIKFGDEKVPGLSPGEVYLNRNKKSITLNLKSEEGRDVFYRLVKESDVVVEGFRPGVVKRLGIDYETLREINPRIVYCSISGFGQTGPRRLQAGHDINYISLAGILGISGRSDGPPVIPPVQMADLGGGSLMALSGILMALYRRNVTGEGSYVDVSMYDGVFSLLSIHAALYLASGEKPLRGKGLLTGLLPSYNVYRCRDGRYLAVGALEGWFFDRMCELMGREDLKGNSLTPDPDERIIGELEKEFAKRDSSEWCELFEGEDVCVTLVYDFEEVFEDPQLKDRSLVIETEHPAYGLLRQPGFPIKFSGGGGDVRSPAPALGEHDDEILSLLGYTDDEITSLREKGIVRKREE